MRFQHLAEIHPARHTHRVEDDVDRGAVLKERHVFHGEDLGDDALVAVPAGELVTVGDLPLLRDVDAHQLVDTWRQLVALLTVEQPSADALALFAVRHLEAGVTYLAGLLAEDRTKQTLLRSQLGLALWGDLADQDVAVGHLGADADDAALVKVREDLLRDVRDVPSDLLRAELGVTGIDLVLLDVDRGEDVLLNQARGQDDRVLVVVAFPRHERDEKVLAERHLTVVRTRPVGDDLADLDAAALFHDGLLVDAGALVGAAELLQAVGRVGAILVGHRNVVGRRLLDDARLLRGDHIAGIHRAPVFHAGAHERRLGPQQRHGLPLHVGAHERTVGVVVLEERNHRGSDGGHLARPHVHVVDLVARDEIDLAEPLAYEDAVLDKSAVAAERSVGLRDDMQVFLIGGQVVNPVRDLAVLDLSVGRLDEAERVDPAVGRQRAHETDVRTLRSLDRTHPAVVRRMDVADLETGPLPGQTARAERGQPPLVGQACQRVGLVHELGQLGGAEELLDRRHHRTNVDQGLRCDRLDVLSGHPLADDALHPGKAGADLVLDELADGAQAAVAEVVDVVDLNPEVALRGLDLCLAGVQSHQVFDRRDDVLDGQHARFEPALQTELLVDLVAADLGEVVALRVEVEVLQEGLRRLTGGWLARAQLAVDVKQRLVLAVGVILLERLPDRVVVPELLEDLVVAPAEGLEEHGDALLALAVDAYPDHVALVDLELEPRATGRNDL